MNESNPDPARAAILEPISNATVFDSMEVVMAY